jgi:integrase
MVNKESTTQRAQNTILKFWENQLGHERVDTLTAAKIIKYRDLLALDRKCQSGTVRQYMALLKAMLNVSVNDLAWIPRSPMAKLTLPKDSLPRERYLTKDEIQRLLHACNYSRHPQLYPFVYLAIHTALRYSELLNIQFKDFDMKKRTITIPKTKNKRIHTAYLTEDVYNVLCNHMEHMLKAQPYNWQGMRWDRDNNKFYFFGDAYLFPAEKTDKPVYLVKAWRRALKIANLNDGTVVFHTIRHTTLSMLANAFLGYFELAYIEDNKDYRSTRRYTKGDAEMIRKNFNRIGDLIK